MPRKTPPPDPDQPPFITDSDMPPGTLAQLRRGRPTAGPALTHVYVLTDSAAPRAAPLAAFTTLAAAQAAAARRPAPRPAVEVVPLYEPASGWDGR